MSEAQIDPVLMPASGSLSGRITSANAADMARRRAAKQREEKERLELEAAEAEILRAKLSAETPQSGRIAGLIRQLEEKMDQEGDADAWQKLSAAHARLFSAWQVLTGTPNPGSRKAGKSRNQPVSPILPTEPETPSP